MIIAQAGTESGDGRRLPLTLSPYRHDGISARFERGVSVCQADGRVTCLREVLRCPFRLLHQARAEQRASRVGGLHHRYICQAA